MVGFGLGGSEAGRKNAGAFDLGSDGRIGLDFFWGRDDGWDSRLMSESSDWGIGIPGDEAAISQS